MVYNETPTNESTDMYKKLINAAAHLFWIYIIVKAAMGFQMMVDDVIDHFKTRRTNK